MLSSPSLINPRPSASWYWPTSLLLQAIVTGLVISLWLTVNRDATGNGLMRVHPASVHWAGAGPAAGAAGGAASWTPFLLSQEAQEWALAAARQNVPSLVIHVRRLLTAQLALGSLTQGIPGDFVETGVYQGGTSIILLQALDQFDTEGTRKFWAADSFQGLPDPVDQDAGGVLRKGVRGDMSAGRELFESNVRAWKIASLDKRLRVLEGWFNETLPAAPIQSISYLRLDGDLYVSTMDGLEALYDKVSPGGLIYVDDYGSFTGCRRAVDEFRRRRGVTAPLMLQALPEQLMDAPPGEARWEAAWPTPCLNCAQLLLATRTLLEETSAMDT